MYIYEYIYMYIYIYIYKYIYIYNIQINLRPHVAGEGLGEAALGHLGRGEFSNLIYIIQIQYIYITHVNNTICIYMT